MPDLHWIAGPQARTAAVVAGVLLLLLGRRLFWLFVGVVGFLVAYRLALQVIVEPAWARLALAVVAGLAGVLLAVVVQKLGVALAGFCVGAWAAAAFLGIRVGLPFASPDGMGGIVSVGGGRAVIALVAGIVAALLAVWLFDLALIVLSSLAGAGLLADACALRDGARLALIVLLLVVGVVVQRRVTARPG